MYKRSYHYDEMAVWQRKEGNEMAGSISYDKLKNMMEEQRLSSYRIRKEKIISESTLQNIRKGKGITTDAIASLCGALRCQPGDILEYIPETDTEE